MIKMSKEVLEVLGREIQRNNLLAKIRNPNARYPLDHNFSSTTIDPTPVFNNKTYKSENIQPGNFDT